MFHDDDRLDTVFDAGGRVTFSLTAVSVASQLLWPADFLQSSTLMSKVGLAFQLNEALILPIQIIISNDEIIVLCTFICLVSRFCLLFEYQLV